MIKALFLDMDETLCDTSGADVIAARQFKELLKSRYPNVDSTSLVGAFFQGIYKNLDSELSARFLPIENEANFRLELLELLLNRHGLEGSLSQETLEGLMAEFNAMRMAAFDFFPGVKELLVELRSRYQLVVITNGPVYSQEPKVARVKMSESVDHIIIGGAEPEEKPARSIFNKALGLVGLKANEVLHVGDSLHSDIGGAKLSGIRNVWICGTQEQERQFEHTPDFTIHSFCEIEKVLSRF